MGTSVWDVIGNHSEVLYTLARLQNPLACGAEPGSRDPLVCRTDPGSSYVLLSRPGTGCSRTFSSSQHHLSELLTRKWLGGSHAVDTICVTLEDYFNDFSKIKKPYSQVGRIRRSAALGPTRASAPGCSGTPCPEDESPAPDGSPIAKAGLLFTPTRRT